MILALIFLLALLLFPLAAILHLPAQIDLRLICAYAMVVSFLAYRAHRADKRKALAGEWRIPEKNLHLLELLGGWPGAFLAQRRFRHKVRKFSYQFTFWVIICAYEIAAYDFIQHWRLARQILSLP